MSKRPRRNHAPALKAKVALEAQKGEQTIVELAERYQVHPPLWHANFACASLCHADSPSLP